MMEKEVPGDKSPNAWSKTDYEGMLREAKASPDSSAGATQKETLGARLRRFVGGRVGAKGSLEVESPVEDDSMSVENLAGLGLHIRDLVNVYEYQKSSNPEEDMRLASTNMAEAVVVLFGSGIRGEIAGKSQGGIRESMDRLYGRMVQNDVNPPVRPILISERLEAARVAEWFEAVAQSISQRDYPADLNRQIAFDSAMVFAHLLFSPDLNIDPKQKNIWGQKLVNAEKILDQGS